MLLNEVIATKFAEAVRKCAQQPSAHALLHFGEAAQRARSGTEDDPPAAAESNTPSMTTQ
jgi:hypothetical protein